MHNPGYFTTRFPHLEKRSRVWRVLAGEFQRWIEPDWAVIDLGAGYCDLINNLRARERHALDVWPEVVKFAAPGVVAHVASVTDMRELAYDRFDAAFASNLLEHLEWAELRKASNEIRRILKPGGRLVLLQPNYRYAYREYFDDYTHRIALSDISIRDFLESCGWKIVELIPRFVPLTIRGWMPLCSVLMKLYLRSPLKPFARQMLVVAEKGQESPRLL